MNRHPHLQFGTALTLAALAFAPSPAMAEDPIAIGWVGPLSPPGNYSGGQEMQWAVQLEVDQINKAGGVLGRQIEVTYEDTKGQPAEGSAAAVRLITKDNVAAIIGEFHSSVALAEIEEAHKYGVPWVGTDVWADAITAKQYPEVFRLAPANSLVYVKAADWTVEQDFKNIAIVAENTDFGQGGAQVIAGELKAKGVPYTMATVDLNQQDFTPALLRLMSQSPRPDVIQMVIAGQAQYQLVKQACQLGLEAHDTLGVVVEAIRKAGSADRAAIVKALEEIKYEGVNATYSFPADKTPDWAFHQFKDVPFTIIQYTEENQSPEDAAIVYPKVWATTDKILPGK
jgi:branched-chain amino acid transport system substrate-binding protein